MAGNSPEATQRWYQNNRERWRQYHQARRGRLSYKASRFARKSNERAKALGIEGRLNATELQAIVGSCVYCGREGAEWDHVVPLVRGGANAVTNIVRSCRPCNLSKGMRTPEEWRAGIKVPLPQNRVLRGERIGNSKLTEQQVREIYRRHAAGESQGELGRLYGVNQTTIGRIVRGLKWTHLGLLDADRG